MAANQGWQGNDETGRLADYPKPEKRTSGINAYDENLNKIRGIADNGSTEKEYVAAQVARGVSAETARATYRAAHGVMENIRG